MTESPQAPPVDAAFHQLLTELRPKLHRYCSRLVGSVIDGEDIVQDVLLRALESWPRSGPLENPEGWVFRIAHNAALDVLRLRHRRAAIHLDEEQAHMIIDTEAEAARELASTAPLATLMRLPVSQRSSVILMDVLGYSLLEISEVVGITVPAVRSALHRGRTRLRALSESPDDESLATLEPPQRERLHAYVERFNAHDFDAVRRMLADDVRLDLVSVRRVNGRTEVERYFGNYSRTRDWRLVPGLVEGREAALVLDKADISNPLRYFVLLDWSDGRLIQIRDFRYARYVIDGAHIAVLE